METDSSFDTYREKTYHPSDVFSLKIEYNKATEKNQELNEEIKELKSEIERLHRRGKENENMEHNNNMNDIKFNRILENERIKAELLTEKIKERDLLINNIRLSLQSLLNPFQPLELNFEEDDFITNEQDSLFCQNQTEIMQMIEKLSSFSSDFSERIYKLDFKMSSQLKSIEKRESEKDDKLNILESKLNEFYSNYNNLKKKYAKLNFALQEFKNENEKLTSEISYVEAKNRKVEEKYVGYKTKYNRLKYIDKKITSFIHILDQSGLDKLSKMIQDVLRDENLGAEDIRSRVGKLQIGNEKIEELLQENDSLRDEVKKLNLEIRKKEEINKKAVSLIEEMAIKEHSRAET